MVKISVIIPTYNNAKFLKKTINSVYMQTLNDIEVICVDDGSTDNTLKVLNSLKEKYSSLIVISQKNQGPGIARNTGINNANGEFVIFLDSDDIFIDKNALEEMYNLAIKEKLDMVSANMMFVDKKYKVKKINHHYESGDYLYFNKLGVINTEDYGIPYGFTKAIFNLNFLLTNNIYFPNYFSGEDPIFLAKIFVKLSKIGTVPLTIYGYNHTVGGGVNNKINTYTKKKEYIQHFKIVCDLLSEGKLQGLSNQYKTHLFKYLIWSTNVSDVDLFRIFNETFKDVEPNYFDKNDEDYIKFIISYQFYKLKHSNSNEMFNKIKKEFSEFPVELIDDIQYITLKRYLLIVNSNSLEEFKIKYKKLNLEKLENENKHLKHKNINLLEQNKNLKETENEIKQFNKSLLNSSSWKITKPLRKLMKLF